MKHLGTNPHALNYCATRGNSKTIIGVLDTLALREPEPSLDTRAYCAYYGLSSVLVGGVRVQTYETGGPFTMRVGVALVQLTDQCRVETSRAIALEARARPLCVCEEVATSDLVTPHGARARARPSAELPGARFDHDRRRRRRRRRRCCGGARRDSADGDGRARVGVVHRDERADC